MTDDLAHMVQAIDLARQCEPEDERVHPLVGAVLVKDGKILGTAYRGEREPGAHAEFTLLETKLAEEDVTGGTMFVTLEPCTNRKSPKLPCAHRLIERGIDRVVVGMLDPNPVIQGEGIFQLRDAGIEVQFFPKQLMATVEDLNRDFITVQRRAGAVLPPVTKEFIDAAVDRSLDEWYANTNRVYWNSNFHLSLRDVLSHLQEVLGGLSSAASGKRKPEIDIQTFIAKTIAWWFALCGKAGVESVEEVLWDKFPGVCPYCHQNPHNPVICQDRKDESRGVDWDELTKAGREELRPSRLGGWQKMFADIYPVQQTDTYERPFARLVEEQGELAEATRIFVAEPGHFLNEVSDVFAWLMQVQNILESQNRVRAVDRGNALERKFAASYPDGCTDCGSRLCRCPPILPSTIGRIAREVPTRRAGFDEAGRFLTSEQLSRKFRPSILGTDAAVPQRNKDGQGGPKETESL